MKIERIDNVIQVRFDQECRLQLHGYFSMTGDKE